MPKLPSKDPLAAVRRDPSKVKTFELNPANARNHGFDVQPLAAFPEELLACKNLERLDIFRGIRGPSVKIPDEIGKLTALEELTLGGLSIKTLPDTIGRLKQLTRLSLDYNEQLATLPDSIGELTRLEQLRLSYTALTKLPKSIGKLKRLKSLQLHKVVDVPKELFDLTSLETLDLGEARKIPAGLGNLTHLKELTIHSEALASAGADIAKLSKLQSIFIRGGNATPPPEIFAVPTLVSLHARGVALASLPPLDKLVKLERLDVSDNKLTTLAAAVAVLPKLQELGFSGNPLPLAEKRAIDAMMKLKPKDRAAKVPASARSAKSTKAAKAAPVAGTPASNTSSAIQADPDKDLPGRLGDVVGLNASLGILIAEGDVAAKYRGTNSGDWERATAATDKADAAPFVIGKGKGLVLSLEVGQGKASVWWLDDGSLVIVEAIFETDENSLGDDDRALFHEFISAPPAKGTKPSGRLQLKHTDDWSLVVAPTTEDCSDVAKLLKKISSGQARTCGAEGSGLLIDVVSTDWALFVERPVKAAWGVGRRAILTPD